MVLDLPEPWRLVEPAAQAAPRRAASSAPTSPRFPSPSASTRRSPRIRRSRSPRPSRPCSDPGTSPAPPCGRPTGWSRTPAFSPWPAGSSRTPAAARGRRPPGAPGEDADAADAPRPRGGVMLERYFRLREHGTTVATEVVAGPHDVHGHGLHHLREPGDPLLRRHPGRSSPRASPSRRPSRPPAWSRPSRRR